MSHNHKIPPRGVIATVTVLVVMAALLSLGLSMALVGQNAIVLSGVYQDGETAFSIADACTEEGIMRLKTNIAYSGGTFPLDDGTCTITIANLGPSNWLVQGTGTYLHSIRMVEADISLLVNSSGKARRLVINTWTEAN